MSAYPSDAHLWSLFNQEVRRMKPGAHHEEIESDARVLVAHVRRERGRSGATTWAPGGHVPDGVTRVYDLDGDIWVREPGGEWTMPAFDEHEHEIAASDSYTSVDLLRRYGPLTEAPKRGSNSTSLRS